MNLYPYNYYLLYISIFIVIITLIMTFLKSMPLLKELSKLSKSTISINENIQISANKINAVTTKINKTVKAIKNFIPLATFGIFVINAYKSSEEKGLKRINNSLINATKKTITKRNFRK